MIENLTEDIVKGPTLFRAFAKVFAIPVAAPHTHASVNATNGENVFLHHLLLLAKIVYECIIRFKITLLLLGGE